MKKNILIATTQKTTFIQNHIDNLNGNIFFIHGATIPIYKDDGNPFLSDSFFFILLEKIINKVGFGYFFRKKAIEKYLIDNSIDVILAEYGHVGVNFVEMCLKLKIPLYVYFFGYDGYSSSILKKYKSKYYKLNKVDGVFAVSKDLVKKIIEFGVNKDNVYYLPCGPNISLPEIDLIEYEINFISVGTFTEKKAPDLTIKAFKILNDKIPSSKLIMVGEGELLLKCKNLVNKLNLNNSVLFVGRKSLIEIYELQKKCRAFVQHSIIAMNGDSEGTPVAILEASAVGLPIISTMHGGINESVLHNKTGLLSNERDYIDMSRNMLKLAENISLAKKLGKEGIIHIKLNYNNHNLVKELNTKMKLM